MKAETFNKLTGYQFTRPELLNQALTHRSYSRSGSNERLEFLGDSVLNLVISNHIFRRFENADEGELSRLRASLVKQETLAKVAREINLGEYVHLGGGELKSGGYRRDSILSDALEAVIGAIYLDSDYQRTASAILDLFRTQLQGIDIETSLKDPKTRLQEYLQAKKSELPRYRLDKTSGKSHSQIFTISCVLSDPELQASGSGTSRKKAEQDAAQKILDLLKS